MKASIWHSWSPEAAVRGIILTEQLAAFGCLGQLRRASTSKIPVAVESSGLSRIFMGRWVRHRLAVTSSFDDVSSARTMVG
jgi:hypothetical protein